jgi:hypothetical protein
MALGWGNNAWGDNGWGGTLALTGVTATGNVGTVTHSKDVAITGNAESGAVGSVSMGSRTVALTGVFASGAIGTMNKRYWSVIDDNQTPAWQQVVTVWGAGQPAKFS